MNEGQKIMNDFNHDMKYVSKTLSGIRDIVKRGNSTHVMASVNKSIGLCQRNMERMTGIDMDLARQMESQIENARQVYNSYLDAGY